MPHHTSLMYPRPRNLPDGYTSTPSAMSTPLQPFHPPHDIRSITTRPPSYPTLSLPHPFRASPDVILGFVPPSQVIAQNTATMQPHSSAAGAAPRWHSDLWRAIHTPLAPGENLFDPGMDPRRREAILGGWVARDGSEAPLADVGYEEGGGNWGEGGEDRDGGGGEGGKKKRGRRGGKNERRGRGGRGGRG
ncbi:hypothetical protein DE146DRAFT_1964 [Phaeosphaeria sp. MPI-PUGE-AT-0046c]|nr:hypothetical protein DE146DRAFT_1964 [Phaeosphaeria sp. MPI-PUGE-AT-0046c]